MTETAIAEPPDPNRGGGHRSGARRSPADVVRIVLSGFGQTLMTLGFVVLLFVVYEVWITDLYSQRANHNLEAKIHKQWDTDTVDPLLPLPGGKAPKIKLGTGLGNIFLPRLGRDYHFAVVEGTSQADLAIGPGHYAGTALPGGIGNFAVAGHRVGKGEPFLNLDKLRTGDAVIVETKSYWYVYRVLGTPAGKDPQQVRTQVATDNGKAVMLPGREIVQPSHGQVLLPVPDHPGVGPTQQLMTMTTCHPKFTAAKRMIVFARFDTKIASSGTSMPAAVSALYDEVKS